MIASNPSDLSFYSKKTDTTASAERGRKLDEGPENSLSKKSKTFQNLLGQRENEDSSNARLQKRSRSLKPKVKSTDTSESKLHRDIQEKAQSKWHLPKAERDANSGDNSGDRAALREWCDRMKAKNKDLATAPVVEILTGTIPQDFRQYMGEITASNGFIGQALAADLPELMNTPIELDEFSRMLGLKPIGPTEQMGISETYPKVSPKEAFQALGIDPHRVLAEISRLKTSLLSRGSDLPDLSESDLKQDLVTGEDHQKKPTVPERLNQTSTDIENENSISRQYNEALSSPSPSPSILNMNRTPSEESKVSSAPSSQRYKKAHNPLLSTFVAKVAKNKTSLEGDSIGLKNRQQNLGQIQTIDSASEKPNWSGLSAGIDKGSTKTTNNSVAGLDERSIGLKQLGIEPNILANAQSYAPDEPTTLDLNHLTRRSLHELPYEKAIDGDFPTLEPIVKVEYDLSGTFFDSGVQASPSTLSQNSDHAAVDSDLNIQSPTIANDSAPSDVRRTNDPQLQTVELTELESNEQDRQISASDKPATPPLVRQQENIQQTRTIFARAKDDFFGLSDGDQDGPIADKKTKVKPLQAGTKDSELPQAAEFVSESLPNVEAKPQERLGLTQTQELRQELFDKISDQTQALQAKSGGRANISIFDPDHGQVAMSIQLEGSDVNLKFLNASDNFRNAFGGDLTTLKDLFASQNLKLGNLDLENQENPAGDQSFSNRDQQENEQRQENFSNPNPERIELFSEDQVRQGSRLARLQNLKLTPAPLLGEHSKHIQVRT